MSLGVFVQLGFKVTDIPKSDQFQPESQQPRHATRPLRQVMALWLPGEAHQNPGRGGPAVLEESGRELGDLE